MEAPFIFEKQRSFKQLISDTFSFLFQEFSRFFALLAKFYLPILLLTLAVYYLYPHFNKISQSDMTLQVSNPRMPEWINYILYFINIFFLTLFVNSYIELYRKGEETDFAKLFKSMVWHMDRYIVFFFITAALAVVFAFFQSRYEIEEQINGTIFFSLLIFGFTIFFILRYSLLLPLLSSTSVNSKESFKICSQLIKDRVWITFAGYLILCLIAYIFKTSFNYTTSLIINPFTFLRENFFSDFMSLLFRITDMFYIFSITILINVFNYLHFANLEPRLVYEDFPNDTEGEREIDE